MFSEIQDNLFNQKTSLAHGCNCAGAMGKGIAVHFKQKYPEMYVKYKHFCLNNQFVPGSVYAYKTENGFIYNLGTQEHWKTKAKIEYIEQSVSKMLCHAETHNVKTISIPKIGAGLGGLPWETVRSSLVNLTEDHNVHLQVCFI